MVYMGSKNRIAKELLPIITKYLTKDRWYVEPFCGGCNMIDKVEHEKRIANDYNKYIIALFEALQIDIDLPSTISMEEYDAVRNNKDNYPDWYVGFVGFICSFRGKFFGGYVKTSCETRDGNNRNYQREHINNFVRQRANLLDVKYYNKKYSDLNIPQNSVIYCDPPYQDTTGYTNESNFAHDEFWQWCREMSKKGHDVLVSEYQAPSDFICVWEKQVTNSMNTHNTYKPTEKLFVHESIADKYQQNNK